MRRDLGPNLVGHVDLGPVRRLGYTEASAIAHDVPPVRGRRIRRRDAVLQPLPVGDLADPDRAPGDPGGVRGRRRGALYKYEPEEAILAELPPRGVATQIFTGLLENAASEQGARMSAMDNATRNAGDMIDRLTIVYNRSRQRRSPRN